jgi:hypothetical protein
MADNPAAAYLERRTKNLAFFAKNFPGIYSYFKDYKMQTLQLDIRPEADEADFIVNGQHVYGGFGKKYAKEEAVKFNSFFPPGKAVRSVVPITKGEYTNPRFFAERLKELYEYSPIDIENFKGYVVPEFLPMVVCLGVGLGLHIRELQNIRDIHHLVIVEHDPDRFAASLYTAEWWKIVNRQREKVGRSIDFVLLNNVTEWQDVRAAVWNKLIERCPIFPINTYLYNHKADPNYDQVANDINKDIYVHLFSFGNYDDEVNQLNNAIHNFLKPVAKVGKASAVNLPALGKSGVCIVGSGPSLDHRIGDLRVLSGKALIFSCGTALGALLKHGIVPDLHVELESDYITYRIQSQNADLEALKKVRILGAAQLSPKLFDLFGEGRLFFKAESPLSGLFGDTDERIVDAAPTCTNAALAIAFHYKFSHIYLFGLDYGFPSVEMHHAKGTLYYNEESRAKVSKNLDNETIEIDAASGGKIKSTTFLYTAKRRTDNLIISIAKTSSVLNFSDGARIERAAWVPPHQGYEYVKGLSDIRLESLSTLFGESPVTISEREIKTQILAIEAFFKDFCQRVARIVAEPVSGVAQMTSICFRVNQFLHDKVMANSASYYYFVRGSIWHFLHAGYSHAFAITDEFRRKLWLEWWQDRFLAFLKDWPEHLSSVLNKEYDQNDHWLERSIRQRKENDKPITQDEYQKTRWLDTGFKYSDKAGFHASGSNQETVS